MSAEHTRATASAVETPNRWLRVEWQAPSLPCTACTNDGIASVTPRRTHERECRAYPEADRVCGGDTQPVSAVRMASPQPALHCVHERRDHEREPVMNPWRTHTN